MSRCATALVVVLFSLPTSLSAQTITATINGLVKDPKGGAIPGAVITVTSLETKQKKSATTDNGGRYNIPFLPPGAYDVAATAPGFGRSIENGLPLDAGQVVELNINLPLESTKESVIVRADSPLLVTEASSLETTVENKLITELPSGERSTLSFINLIPGMIDGGFALGQGENLNTNGNAQGPIGTAGNRNFFDSNFAASGGQVSTNDVLIDGVSDTIGDFNGVAVSPPQDSIREFKVVTGAISSEYGRTGGAVVNFITKSGTDKYHGALYDYFQNGALNANGWQRNRRGTNPDGSLVLPRIPLKRNQFGAAIGGPVEMPKLGKLKQTFFFFNYEGRREANPYSRILTVPTDRMRTGDLSQLLTGGVRTGQTDVNGSASLVGQIYDPYAPLVGGKRQAIPGNRLDLLPKCPATGDRTSACLDPVALAFMKYLPSPNQPGLTNNLLYSGTTQFQKDLYAARIDKTINERHSFFGRISIENRYQADPNFLGSLAANSRTIQDKFFNGTFNEVWVVSPSIINNVRYGYTRAHAHQVLISEGSDPSTLLGLPSYIGASGPVPAFPIFNFSSAGAEGSGLPGELTSGVISGAGNNQPRDTQTVADSLTWSKGRQTISVGAEYRLYRFFAFAYASPDGTFTFSRTATRGPVPSATPANATDTGSSLASLFLGLPGTITKENDIPLTLYHHYGALYFQDDFRLSSRLTLNLGLRWDVETNTGESHNQVTAFDTNAPSPLNGKPSAVTDAAVLALRGNYSPLNGLLSFPQGAQSRTHLNRFAPRVGFAYRLNSRMAVRGGYALFYVPISVEQSTAIGSVFGVTQSQSDLTTQVIPSGTGASPTVFLSNPFPAGIPAAPGNSQGANTLIGSSITITTPDKPNAYVQTWNLVLQRQLARQLILDIAYVGSRGLHLPAASMNLNQLPASVLDFAKANYSKYGATTVGGFFTAQVPNPFFGVITNSTSSLRTATVTRAQLLTPFPQYTGVSLYRPNIGESSYHAVQISVQKRFSGTGLSATGNYVHSKSIDTGGPGNNSGNGTSIEDIYNIRLDRSISNFDVPDRITGGLVYELPFFRKTSNPLLKTALSGWQLAGTAFWQRGTPITITTPNNIGLGFAVIQPNVLSGVTQGYSVTAAENNARQGLPWFNTAAFTQPPSYTLGNAARNFSGLRRDNYKNANLSITRNFKIRERLKGQFRAEFINAFNTVVFGTPGRDVSTPSTFGIITTQGNSPRTVQMVLRFTY